MHSNQQVFPNPGVVLFNEIKGQRDGIEARDFVAIEAMKALITSSGFNCTPTTISDKAYELADAMLASSKKKPA